MSQLELISKAIVQIAECIDTHIDKVSFEMNSYEQGRFFYYADEPIDIKLGHVELFFESLDHLNELLSYIEGFHTARKKYKL